MITVLMVVAVLYAVAGGVLATRQILLEWPDVEDFIRLCPPLFAPMILIVWLILLVTWPLMYLDRED